MIIDRFNFLENKNNTWTKNHFIFTFLFKYSVLQKYVKYILREKKTLMMNQLFLNYILLQF